MEELEVLPPVILHLMTSTLLMVDVSFLELQQAQLPQQHQESQQDL